MWPFKYPYTNFHEINLDWIIRKIEELPGLVKTEVGKAINQIYPESNPATKYIFLGDSYGAIDNPWPSWVSTVAERLDLRSNEYWNLAKNSTSLAAGNWRVILNNWINSASEEDKRSIRYVILGGGINDSHEELIEKIDPEMRLIVGMVEENLPNAEIFAGYFGYTTSARISDPRTPENREKAFTAWQKSIKYGVHFIPDAVNCVHSIDLLYIDGIHPNSEGASNIANALINGLRGCGYNQIISDGYEKISNGVYSIRVPASVATPYTNQYVNINDLLINFLPVNGRMCDKDFQLSTFVTGFFEIGGVNVLTSLPVDLIYDSTTGAFNGVIRPSIATNGQTSIKLLNCEIRVDACFPSIEC